MFVMTLSYIVVQRCYNFLISYLADLYFYVEIEPTICTVKLYNESSVLLLLCTLV